MNMIGNLFSRLNPFASSEGSGFVQNEFNNEPNSSNSLTGIGDLNKEILQQVASGVLDNLPDVSSLKLTTNGNPLKSDRSLSESYDFSDDPLNTTYLRKIFEPEQPAEIAESEVSLNESDSVEIPESEVSLNEGDSFYQDAFDEFAEELNDEAPPSGSDPQITPERAEPESNLPESPRVESLREVNVKAEGVAPEKARTIWNLYGWMSRAPAQHQVDDPEAAHASGDRHTTAKVAPADAAIAEARAILKQHNIPDDVVLFIEKQIPDWWTSLKDTIADEKGGNWDNIVRHLLDNFDGEKLLHVLLLKIFVNLIIDAKTNQLDFDSNGNVIEQLLKYLAGKVNLNIDSIKQSTDELDIKIAHWETEIASILVDLKPFEVKLTEIRNRLAPLTKQLEGKSKELREVNRTLDSYESTVRSCEDKLEKGLDSGGYALNLTEKEELERELINLKELILLKNADKEKLEGEVQELNTTIGLIKLELAEPEAAKAKLDSEKKQMEIAIAELEAKKLALFSTVTKDILKIVLPKGSDEIIIPGLWPLLNGSAKWFIYGKIESMLPSILLDFSNKEVKNRDLLKADAEEIKKHQAGGNDLVNMIALGAKHLNLFILYVLTKHGKAVEDDMNATGIMKIFGKIAGDLPEMAEAGELLKKISNYSEPILMHIFKKLSKGQVAPTQHILTYILDDLNREAILFSRVHSKTLKKVEPRLRKSYEAKIAEVRKKYSDMNAPEAKKEMDEAFQAYCKDFSPTMSLLVDVWLQKAGLDADGLKEVLPSVLVSFLAKKIKEALMAYSCEFYRDVAGGMERDPLKGEFTDEEAATTNSFVSELVKNFSPAVKDSLNGVLDGKEALIGKSAKDYVQSLLPAETKVEVPVEFFQSPIKGLLLAEDMKPTGSFLQEWIGKVVTGLLGNLAKTNPYAPAGKRNVLESSLIHIATLIQQNKPANLTAELKAFKAMPEGDVKAAKRKELEKQFEPLAKIILEKGGWEGGMDHVLLPGFLKTTMRDMLVNSVLPGQLLSISADILLPKELSEDEKERLNNGENVKLMAQGLTEQILPAVREFLSEYGYGLANTINESSAKGNLSAQDEAVLGYNLNQAVRGQRKGLIGNHRKNGPTPMNAAWDLVQSCVGNILEYGLGKIALKGPRNGDAIENIFLYMMKSIDGQTLDPQVRIKLDEYIELTKELTKVGNDLAELRKIAASTRTAANKPGEVDGWKRAALSIEKDAATKAKEFAAVEAKAKEYQGLKLRLENEQGLKEKHAFLLEAFKPYTTGLLKDMGFEKSEDLPHLPAALKETVWKTLQDSVLPDQLLKAHLALRASKQSGIDSIESIRNLGIMTTDEAGNQKNIADQIGPAADGYADFAVKLGINYVLARPNEMAHRLLKAIGVVRPDEVKSKALKMLGVDRAAVYNLPGLTSEQAEVIANFGKDQIAADTVVVQAAKENISDVIKAAIAGLANGLVKVESHANATGNSNEKSYEAVMGIVGVLSAHFSAATSIAREEGVANIHQVPQDVMLKKFKEKGQLDPVLDPTLNKEEKEAAVALLNDQLGEWICKMAFPQGPTDLKVPFQEQAAAFLRENAGSILMSGMQTMGNEQMMNQILVNLLTIVNNKIEAALLNPPPPPQVSTQSSNKVLSAADQQNVEKLAEFINHIRHLAPGTLVNKLTALQKIRNINGAQAEAILKSALSELPLSKLILERFVAGVNSLSKEPMPLTREEFVAAKEKAERTSKDNEIKFYEQMRRPIELLRQKLELSLDKIPIFGVLLKWILKPFILVIFEAWAWNAGRVAPKVRRNLEAPINANAVYKILRMLPELYPSPKAMRAGNVTQHAGVDDENMERDYSRADDDGMAPAVTHGSQDDIEENDDEDDDSYVTAGLTEDQ